MGINKNVEVRHGVGRNISVEEVPRHAGQRWVGYNLRVDGWCAKNYRVVVSFLPPHLQQWVKNIIFASVYIKDLPI